MEGKCNIAVKLSKCDIRTIEHVVIFKCTYFLLKIPTFDRNVLDNTSIFSFTQDCVGWSRLASRVRPAGRMFDTPALDASSAILWIISTNVNESRIKLLSDSVLDGLRNVTIHFTSLWFADPTIDSIGRSACSPIYRSLEDHNSRSGRTSRPEYVILRCWYLSSLSHRVGPPRWMPAVIFAVVHDHMPGQWFKISFDHHSKNAIRFVQDNISGLLGSFIRFCKMYRRTRFHGYDTTIAVLCHTRITLVDHNTTNWIHLSNY